MNKMKRLLSLSFVLINICSSLIAQNIERVYTKDGNIYEGFISEQIPGEYISIFAENTAKQFKQGIEKLESQGIESLIIDVRYNTGGHLTTVVDMLSCLLDSSKVIYQIEEKGEITKYYSKGEVTKK